jgi:hypothetical protein
MATIGHADDVVDLDLAAGANAEVALDASVEIETSAAGRPSAGKRLTATSMAPAQRQNSDFGSWAMSGFGWSATRSSMTMRRAVFARSLSVVTSMPALGLRMQDAANTRSPLISTMQARQLPSAR